MKSHCFQRPYTDIHSKNKNKNTRRDSAAAEKQTKSRWEEYQYEVYAQTKEDFGKKKKQTNKQTNNVCACVW